MALRVLKWFTKMQSYLNMAKLEVVLHKHPHLCNTNSSFWFMKHFQITQLKRGNRNHVQRNDTCHGRI